MFDVGDLTFSGGEAELVAERLEQLLIPDHFAHQHEVARSIAGKFANRYRRRINADAALDYRTALKAAQEVVLHLRVEQWSVGGQVRGRGGKGRHPFLVAWPGSRQHPCQLTCVLATKAADLIHDVFQEVAVDAGLGALDDPANVAAARYPDLGLAQAPSPHEDQQEAKPHAVAALVDPDLSRNPRCRAADLDDPVGFAVNEQHLRAGVGKPAVVAACVGHALFPALAHFVAAGLRNRVANLPELPHESVALVVPRQPKEELAFLLGHDGPDLGEPPRVALIEVVACGDPEGRGWVVLRPVGLLRESCRGRGGHASKAAQDGRHDEAIQSASKPVERHAAVDRVTAEQRSSPGSGVACDGSQDPATDMPDWDCYTASSCLT